MSNNTKPKFQVGDDVVREDANLIILSESLRILEVRDSGEPRYRVLELIELKDGCGTLSAIWVMSGLIEENYRRLPKRKG